MVEGMTETYKAADGDGGRRGKRVNGRGDKEVVERLGEWWW